MNRYFDFTNRQLKFIALLTIFLIISGGYLLIKSISTPGDIPQFEVHIGETDQVYTGIFLLDPNISPADSLELLPGIGRVLSDRIVEYRKTHHYNDLVDITEVRGIGPKLYEKIKPYLKIQEY